MKTILCFFVQLPIAFYRWCVSPFLPVACRFHPTCSHYAQEAFERHGFLRGGWLSLVRILRCNPWGGSGFDAVPQHSPNSEP